MTADLDTAAVDAAARALVDWIGDTWDTYAGEERDTARESARLVIDTYLTATTDDQAIGTRHFLELPYDRPPKGLTANGSHGNYHAKAGDTKRVRAAVTRIATEAGIQPCTHLGVWLYWAPGDNRRRDADNLWPMLKVCCDALAKGPRKDWVGLELVPDDTPQHMTKHAPRIVPPHEAPARGMWLVIDALDAAPPAPAPACPQPQAEHRAKGGHPAARSAHTEPTGARPVDVPAKPHRRSEGSTTGDDQ